MTEWAAPSDFGQTGIVAYYELYRSLRSYRLLGMVALAILIFALIYIVPPALGQEYPKDPAYYAQRFYMWSGVLIVIGATLFSGDSLSSEFQSRTGFLMFPNPVKRGSFFAGKLIASLAILFLVVTAYYVMVSLATIWETGDLSDLTYRSYALALLYSVASVGVGYLVSAIMRGSTEAMVLTLAILFLILPIVDGVLSFAGVKPWFSLTFNGQAISDIMIKPYPQDELLTFPIGGRLLGGNGASDIVQVWSYHPELRDAPLVMAAYAAITVAAALIIFRRREMAA